MRYCLAQSENHEQNHEAFGLLKGCFQTPSTTQAPDSDIDCPAVSPLTFSNSIVNREAMNDPNKHVHPDSVSKVKYCLGTRIQMQKGKSSHKLQTCQYHDVNKSKQGKFLRTMTQEAMNVSSRHCMDRPCFMTFQYLPIQFWQKNLSDINYFLKFRGQISKNCISKHQFM